MNILSENYMSVVIVTYNDRQIREVVGKVHSVLKNNFKYFEIIVVDNFSDKQAKETLSKITESIILLTLPSRHNTQQALTAGVEAAIGDYILEIPDVSSSFDERQIMKMYEAGQAGNDFVFLSPKRISFTSQAFYNLLNGIFKNVLNSNFVSSVMTLSSRRGINKTADVSRRQTNRNISYVLTGLNCKTITVDSKGSNKRKLSENIALLIDTLIYYTNFINTIAIGVSLGFFALTIFAIVYAFVAYAIKDTAPGWTSMFILLSGGFGVLFILFSIVCKYLYHILNIQNSKSFSWSAIDKRKGGNK